MELPENPNGNESVLQGVQQTSFPYKLNQSEASDSLHVESTHQSVSSPRITHDEQTMHHCLESKKKRSSHDISKNGSHLTPLTGEATDDKGSVRVLLCGDVGGRLKELSSCLEVANQKHGPFHFLLCCGSFFSPHDSSVSDDTASFSFPSEDERIAVGKDEEPFLSAQTNFCLPVYFIDSSHSPLGYQLRSRSYSTFSFSPTLTYLGNFGFVNLHGLTVGFLSGLYRASYFFGELVFDHTTQGSPLLDTQGPSSSGVSGVDTTATSGHPITQPKPLASTFNLDFSSPVSSLCSTNDASGPYPKKTLDFVGDYSTYYSRAAIQQFKVSCFFYSGQCDILISSEWPAGLDQTLSVEQREQLQTLLQVNRTNLSISKISPVLSEIVELLEPRYHIASGRNVFYQRPYYKTTTHGLISKFIGMASVPASSEASLVNPGSKFLHALILQPMMRATPQSLKIEPSSCTPSPYFLYTPAHREPRCFPLPSDDPCSGVAIQKKLPVTLAPSDALGPFERQDVQTRDEEKGETWPKKNEEKLAHHETDHEPWPLENIQTETLSHPLGKRHKKDACVKTFTTPPCPQGSPNHRKCVFVSNIPYQVDCQSFMDIMASFGEIVNVHMPRTGDGKSVGRAWITYSREEDALQATEANEQLQSGGRLLKIRFSHAKKLGGYSNDKSRGQTPSSYEDNESRPPRHRSFGTGVGLTPQAIDVRPHTGCWFCLANPDCEKRLIISLGSKVYVALAKGGLVAHHVLIIPVTHFPNYIFCPPNVSVEMEAYIDALRRCFKAQNQDIIVYERYFPMKVTTGMHMQLQVIPIPSPLSVSSVKAFENRAKRAGITLQRFNKEETLKHLGHYVKDSVVQPYLYVELPGQHPDTTERWIYCTSSVEEKGSLPFNFCREAIADLLEKPERSNWKSCVQDCAKEDDLVKHLQKLFSSFEPKN